MSETTTNTKDSFDHEGWYAKYLEKKKEYANSLVPLVAFLKEKGYKFIRVFYEGAGDSGEAYTAEGYKSLKEYQEFIDADFEQTEEWGQKDDGKWGVIDGWKNNNRGQKQLRKDFNEYYKAIGETGPDDISWMLTEAIEYDWYNNEGGGGNIVLDVEKSELITNGFQYYYDTHSVKEIKIIGASKDESN
jgi:hypothetical protein